MIIDTHVHLGGDALDFDMTEEYILYSMEKYNIDFSIVSNVDAATLHHNQTPLPDDVVKSQIESLERTLKFVKTHKNKLGAGVWVRPEKEKCDSKLINIIKENRDYIYYVKCHPYHSGVPFDSEEYEQYFKLAKMFNMPVATHTGGNDNASPQRVYNAAKKHPDVNFIMVHMDLATDHKIAIDLISKLPNLYGDTTWVDVESTLRFLEKNSSKKLLFGTDNPIDGKDTLHHNKKGEKSIYQEYFHKLDKLVSKEDYENIMYKNAIELFNINL